MKKYVRFLGMLSCLGSAFLYWQDNDVVMTKFSMKHPHLPKGLEGFKILHISDLQSKSFGKKQKYLMKEIKKTSPDMIVITGDLIDANRTDLDTAMDLIRQITPIAPVYYVSGNHEFRSGFYEELMTLLRWEGVILLDNDARKMKRKGSSFWLLGLADIRANQNYSFVLNKLAREKKKEFSILLSHRPEIFEKYAERKIDIAFTGHAHGGQIRLPFIGGLFSPNQGFLPKYTSGVYWKGDSAMVVSRGLGNSRFPFRIFNRPELIEVTLQRG